MEGLRGEQSGPYPFVLALQVNGLFLPFSENELFIELVCSWVPEARNIKPNVSKEIPVEWFTVTRILKADNFAIGEFTSQIECCVVVNQHLLICFFDFVLVKRNIVIEQTKSFF